MTVIFTAKELFQQINDRLGKIVDVLETKADHSDVVALDTRVSDLEDKSRQTEAIAAALLHANQSRWSTRRKVYAAALGLMASVPSVAYTISLIQAATP